MRAYRCDRCKKYYETDARCNGKHYIITNISFDISAKVSAKDLCPECTKELEEWWNAGKPEKEAEDESR